MEWKLRIPLMLFVFGAISGLFQKFSEIFLADTSNLLKIIIFIGLIGMMIAILEKTEINEKKISFTAGIGLIFLAVLIDYFMV